MSVHSAKSVRIWKMVLVLTALLALVFASPISSYAQKKKAKAAPELQKRVNFDISKIVWPNPPAIARIKFVQLYTGEKLDFNSPAGPPKPKQGWMDRLAGSKPVQDQNVKIPFQLIRTYGLGFDSKGKIYAADQAAGAIFVFDPEDRYKVELIRNGSDAHFGLIVGLAIDDNDRIFVSDDKLRHIAVINAQHHEETTFGADVLARPGGLAIDKENRLLYAVDTESDVVDVFDADSFKFLRKIGVSGKKHTLTDPGTFSLPTNVAVDKDGNVYVTDTLNDRVEIFDADGQFISTFGKNGDGPGFFARPKGIAVDNDGHIWVVDAVQERVQVFDRDGRLLIYFGEHGGFPGQFQVPYDIAIDGKTNRVIVSEQFQGRVQMFRYITDAEAEQLRKEKDAQQGKTVASAEPKKDVAPVPAGAPAPKDTASKDAAPAQAKPPIKQ